MNIKLKDNVFGFTWNYETGEVGEVFTEELTPREVQLMGRVMGEDICLILDSTDIELVEEGYSEIEIKKYLSIKFKDAQNFLEEYLAL